jgi:uncharacterized DUF497 family protein
MVGDHVAATPLRRVYRSFDRIAFDPVKSEEILAARGFDLAYLARMFPGRVLEREDTRGYRETRYQGIGEVLGTAYFVVYTRAGRRCRPIAAWEGTLEEREQLARRNAVRTWLAIAWTNCPPGGSTHLGWEKRAQPTKNAAPGSPKRIGKPRASALKPTGAPGSYRTAHSSAQRYHRLPEKRTSPARNPRVTRLPLPPPFARFPRRFNATSPGNPPCRSRPNASIASSRA